MQGDPASAIHAALSAFARAHELALLSLHLVCAACVIGAVVAFDLRVVGFARALPLRLLHGLLIPLALVMALPAAASGFLLFSLHADALVASGAFVVKIVALFVAAVTAMMFYTGPYQQAATWDVGLSAPPFARLLALASIAALFSIAVCGVRVATALAVAAN